MRARSAGRESIFFHHGKGRGYCTGCGLTSISMEVQVFCCLDLRKCNQTYYTSRIGNFNSLLLGGFNDLVYQVGESPFLHLVEKLLVIGVLDRLHAKGSGCCDIVGAVVDEEDLRRLGREAFGGVAIDFCFRLGEVERVGPGAVVEAPDPV